MDKKNRFSVFQFIKNAFSNGLLFVINTIISFWFTPYLLQSLGSESYGNIPLITSLVGYFGIISLSINVSTNRYLMIEIEKPQFKKMLIYQQPIFFFTHTRQTTFFSGQK